jgi:hypothetical protein
MALITMLERAVHRNLDDFVLGYWYMYIGVPMCNPSEGGCSGVSGLITWVGGQTARGGGSQETLKPGHPSWVEPIMD